MKVIDVIRNICVMENFVKVMKIYVSDRFMRDVKM